MIDVVNLKEMPEGIMELGRKIKVLPARTSCVFPGISIMLRFGEYGDRKMRLIPSVATLSFSA